MDLSDGDDRRKLGKEEALQRQHISEQEWTQYNAKGKQAFLDKIRKEGKLLPGKSIHHMTVRELDALHQEYLSNEGHLLPIEEFFDVDNAESTMQFLDTSAYENFASSLMRSTSTSYSPTTPEEEEEEDDVPRKQNSERKVSDHEASIKYPEFLSQVQGFTDWIVNYKKSHHSKVSSEMIARGKLLDLKHKVLEAAYDHYGADLGSLFDKVDSERSGYIAIDELSRAVRRLLPDVQQSDLATFERAAAGSNNRKSLSRSEYVAFICNQNKEDAVEAGYFDDASDGDSESLLITKSEATPTLTSERLKKLSIPLDRHRYKPPVDKRLSSNHRGRQRPPVKEPLSVVKSKMEKEYSLGYIDPEKERWEKSQASKIKEVELAEDFNSSKHQRRFTIKLSDFDQWLEENKKWTEAVKGKCQKILEEVTKDKNFVPTRFIPKMSNVLASKAFERYSKELISMKKERENPVDISALTSETADEGGADEKLLRDADEVVREMMFEVLPVHERLSKEAILFNKKTQSRLDELRKPSYSPPKMLQKSKDILGGSKIPTSVSSPIKNRLSSPSFGWDAMSPPPPPPVLAADGNSPLQIDTTKSVDLSVFNLSALSIPFNKGVLVQRSGTPVKKGFGASSPRFGDTKFRAESPIMRLIPPPNTKIPITKVASELMKKRESFDERLNYSIQKLKARKDASSKDIPGPGHYVLPTDALNIKETKTSGCTRKSQQTIRSSSPGFSFGKSIHHAAQSPSSKNRIITSIAGKLEFAARTTQQSTKQTKPASGLRSLSTPTSSLAGQGK